MAQPGQRASFGTMRSPVQIRVPRPAFEENSFLKSLNFYRVKDTGFLHLELPGGEELEDEED